MPVGFFSLLDKEAPFDEVGVACTQLAGFLTEEDGEERHGRGRHSFKFQVGNNAFTDDLDDLRDFGQFIRENLPEWLGVRKRVRRERQEPGEVKVEVNVPMELQEIERLLAELDERIQAVTEQLRQTDLNDAAQVDLAEQLARMGHERAELVRTHARLRERQEQNR